MANALSLLNDPGFWWCHLFLVMPTILMGFVFMPGVVGKDKEDGSIGDVIMAFVVSFFWMEVLALLVGVAVHYLGAPLGLPLYVSIGVTVCLGVSATLLLGYRERMGIGFDVGLTASLKSLGTLLCYAVPLLLVFLLKGTVEQESYGNLVVAVCVPYTIVVAVLILVFTKTNGELLWVGLVAVPLVIFFPLYEAIGMINGFASFSISLWWAVPYLAIIVIGRLLREEDT